MNLKLREILMGVVFLAVAWLLYSNFVHNKGVTFGNTNTYAYDTEGDLVEQFEHKDNGHDNHQVVSSENMGQNEQPQQIHTENRTPSSCFPQKILTAEELLPRDDSAAISDFSQDYPIGEGVQRGVNYLSAGYQIGVNTVGQSLRNANRQIRAEPPNPQVNVSPWLNSTIGPDLDRRPLDNNSCNAN
jgi:hypothetical protein